MTQESSCIITPDEYTQPDQLNQLDCFWQSLGSQTFILSPEDHDEVISRVSHMPHILAAICAHVAFDQPSNGNYAGNGLKDTSRIASGDPHMWEGIISENQDAIIPHLEEAISRLVAYKDAITEQNSEGLLSLLKADKNARDSFYNS